MRHVTDFDFNFTATEMPLWRRTDVATSAMLDRIVEFVFRFELLPQKLKVPWKNPGEGYADFLFQVNKIEKEGFCTYSETLDAIRKGALNFSACSDDPRMESMCCLYRALKHWLNPNTRLSIEDLETSHQLLLGSTKSAIAGRVRSLDHEVVYVETEDEPGFHVFMWPTKVRSTLQILFERTKSELLRITKEADTGQLNLKSRVEQLLKLGGSFFLAFENIHPFMDGNGRFGRILLAHILQSVTPFPNVLFVDSPNLFDSPSFVNPIFYYDCFHAAQSSQKFELQDDGHPLFTQDSSTCILDYPRDLTALIIEGVYVGWKRFFHSIDQFDIQGPITASLCSQEGSDLHAFSQASSENS